MHIASLAGKSICILGYGREGRAMEEALTLYAPGCSIVIADKNPDIRGEKQQMQLGEEWKSNLERFDVVIKSPGIPPKEIENIAFRNLTTPTQIFFDSIQGMGATVIGVTGSKGKSTTASLIAAILKAGKKDVDLIGNIGNPPISYIKATRKNKFFVQELSSYQLADLHCSPHIAVVTSFFPEHLDYHGTQEAYLEAKTHICRFQGKEDIAIFCASSPGAVAVAAEGEGRKLPFSELDSPVRIEDTHLLGTHNLRNIAAAWRVAEQLHISQNIASQAIKNFVGLPHRLQSLGIIGGIEWIDDAISTTPESTIAALDALGDSVQALILGGQDRGVDFASLGKRIAQSHVRLVALFPGSGPRIRKAIEAAGAAAKCIDVNSMESAVCLAKNSIQPNAPYPPIVLLSPASPSYGMYKNFEEKGDDFRREAKSAYKLISL